MSSLHTAFWKLSGAKVNGKAVADLFTHDGISLWWGFKHDLMKTRDSWSSGAKEAYKEFVDLNMRDRSDGGAARADVIFFNTVVSRTLAGQRYFGSVREQIEKRGYRTLGVYTYTPSPKELLQRRRIDGDHDIFGVFDSQLRKIVRKAKKTGRETHRSIMADEEFSGFVKENFPEEVGRIARFMKNACLHIYPRAVLYYELFKRWLEKTGAKVVCSLDYAALQPYAVSAAARKCGARTVWIFHGPFASWKHAIPKELRNELVVPDRICAYGEKDVEEVGRSNFEKKTVRVCGCPRFDHYGKLFAQMDEEKLKRKYGTGKCVLWAPDSPNVLKGKKRTEYVEKIAAAFSGKQTLDIVIKPHPDEKGTDYSGIRNANVVKSGNLLELIRICEAMLIRTSLAGSEAIALGKPVIITDFGGPGDVSIYSDYGFPVAKTAEELAGLTEKLGSDEEKKRFTQRRERFMTDNLANFGHASQKIADVVEELLRKEE